MAGIRSFLILATGVAIGGALAIAHRVSEDTGKGISESFAEVPGEAQRIFADVKQRAEDAMARGREAYDQKQAEMDVVPSGWRSGRIGVVELAEPSDRSDVVVLRAPRRKGSLPVMRVVIGGMASRHALPVDRLDDVELAVETLFQEEPADGADLTLTVAVVHGVFRVTLAGLRSPLVRRTLVRRRRSRGRQVRRSEHPEHDHGFAGRRIPDRRRSRPRLVRGRDGQTDRLGDSIRHSNTTARSNGWDHGLRWAEVISGTGTSHAGPRPPGQSGS